MAVLMKDIECVAEPFRSYYGFCVLFTEFAKSDVNRCGHIGRRAHVDVEKTVPIPR